MDNDDQESKQFSVMIVDDDPNFRALIKVLLESTGSIVLEARSGKDADALLKDNHPNLVIVDYRLPGVDGMQWITKFREAGWTTPVVFLSGSWCDLQVFTKLRTLLKVSLILQKPIVPELFLDQIESLLPRGKAGEYSNQEESSSQQTSEPVLAFDNAPAPRHEPAQAATADLNAYEQPETVSSAREAYQTMDSALPAHDDLVAYAHNEVPVSQSSTSDKLRTLFEGDLHDTSLNSLTPPPRNLGQPKDIMRRSATRMQAFKAPEAAEEKVLQASGEKLPETFGGVPLSKDIPDEMAIIGSEEPDVLEQLSRFSQKASVEMALRNARADYARLLPEKTESLETALQELKTDTSNATYFEEAVNLAHQLKGTSGSLGFPHLGRIAGIIETLLLDGGLRDTTDTGRAWDKLDRQLAQCLSVARANAIAYSRPEGVPRKAFMKRVALVGHSALFATLTHELARDNVAEAYLVDSVDALLNDSEGERFNCVVVDSAALDEQSPTELLEQARDSKRLRNAPFAFIADDTWHADEALWLYTGAEFLLPKSVNPTALLNVVESMLVLNDAEKPRVLTVDDDAVLTGFICDTLAANGIAATALNEPINVMEKLPDFRADLLLLDVVMPGVSGYDVCRMLRADEKFSDLPILFLTSKNSPQGRAAAFKAGADDFLSKPILTEELIARVRSRLELSKPFKDRAGTNNQTGLTTRQAFMDSFSRSLDQASQSGNVFSVVIVTIDKFQELALTFGFKIQEQIFKDLAQLLQARFRVEDLKGHWSEGSFALAFPNVEAAVIIQAMNFLAGEFAVGTTHNSSGPETMTKRLIRFGLGELLTDGVTADTLLAHAYERSMHSEPVDVSSFIALAQEDES